VRKLRIKEYFIKVNGKWISVFTVQERFLWAWVNPYGDDFYSMNKFYNIDEARKFIVDEFEPTPKTKYHYDV